MRIWGFIVATLAAIVLPVAAGPIAYADVNDFTIGDYDIVFRLGVDGDGRSTLKTTETITAEFPMIDQNRGIERAIPLDYDGHPTKVSVKAVTDENGRERTYTTYTDEFGNLVVRIGSPDKYVYGTQTYRIEYTQRDVTRTFADTSADEFYWDTNGTGWKVPIKNLSVATILDSKAASAFNGNSSCYVGGAGSTERCELESNGDTFTTTASGLAPGENVTIALGFNQGTFAAYQQSTFEKLFGWWVVAQVSLTFIALLIGIGFAIWRQRMLDRTSELGTIVAEYLPPPTASVSTSAQVMGISRTVTAAQLIDLAVRHYVKLYQTKDKTLFKPAEYEVELIKNPADLKWEERELLQDSFLQGTSVTVGQRLELSSLRNNTSYYQRLRSNASLLETKIQREYGIRYDDDYRAGKIKRFAKVLGVVGVLLLSPSILFVALIVWMLSRHAWTFTDEGLSLKRYLMGLKQYISVAEEQRLQMLQSPEGAAKTGGADGAQLIRLYERVLPYAVLFGQEKQWNQQIGALYEQSGTQPDWYSGATGAYSAAAFSSAMSGITASSNYGASSSSSSGGSSGGGSSGGGGGGGGGGGW